MNLLNKGVTVISFLYFSYGTYSLVKYTYENDVNVDLIQIIIYSIFVIIGIGLFLRANLARISALSFSYFSLLVVAYFISQGSYGKYQISFSDRVLHSSTTLSVAIALLFICIPLIIHNVFLHRQKTRDLFKHST